MAITVIRRRKAAPSRTPLRKTASDPLDIAGAGALNAATEVVLEALKGLPRTVKLEDVETAIRGRTTTRAYIDPDKLTRQLQKIVPALEEAAAAGARDELRLWPMEKAARQLHFDLVNPAVVDYADQRAAELVVEISESTRATLRTLVQAAVSATEGQASTRSLASAVRSKIGLHSRWARAVLNYQMGLEGAGTPSGTVSTLVSKYYDKLLSARARNIARTEIMKASNAGKIASWRAMEKEGWLGRAQMSKMWEAASDAEEICAAADGQVVLLHDVFSTSEGSFDMPPAHPSCRCTAVLVPGPKDQRAPQPSTPSQRPQPPRFAEEQEAKDWLTSNLIGESDAEMLESFDLATLQQIADEVPAVAERVLATATEAEASVTEFLTSLASDLGADMPGLDFRLKSISSIARKVITDATGDGISFSDAGEAIHDALRFTMTTDAAGYPGVLEGALGQIDAEGWALKGKDFWGSEFYQGVNAQVTDSTGYTWELQFHTDASYYTKEVLEHPVYEELRITTVQERVAELEAQLRQYSDAVPRPEGFGFWTGSTDQFGMRVMGAR